MSWQHKTKDIAYTKIKNNIPIALYERDWCVYGRANVCLFHFSITFNGKFYVSLCLVHTSAHTHTYKEAAINCLNLGMLCTPPLLIHNEPPLISPINAFHEYSTALMWTRSGSEYCRSLSFTLLLIIVFDILVYFRHHVITTLTIVLSMNYHQVPTHLSAQSVKRVHYLSHVCSLEQCSGVELVLYRQPIGRTRFQEFADVLHHEKVGFRRVDLLHWTGL